MYVLNIFIVSTFFITCKSAFVDTLKKCSIDDEQCLNNLYQDVLQRIATEGIPEFEIPAIDPLEVKNISMPIIDSVTLTIVEGVIKGFKSCVFENFKSNLDTKVGSADLICDLNVKGTFKFAGSSPLIQNLLGESSVEGEGSGKIKIDKLRLSLTFPYDLKKRDGDVYIYWPSKGLEYKYDVDKLHFFVEKFYIGKNDLSQLVNAYAGENDKFLLQTFGKRFIDRAWLYVFKMYEKFQHAVPTSKFIIEDLSPFATS